MHNMKLGHFGILLALGASLTPSAYAYTPLNSNTPTGTGPTTLSYVGLNVPCHSSFAIAVQSDGTAAITVAAFVQESGDSSFCPSITANFPVVPSFGWAIGPATLVSGSGPIGTYSATVSGVSVTVPGLHVTCTGSVTLTLNDATGEASFNGTLHNGAIACGVSGTGLATVVRAP